MQRPSKFMCGEIHFLKTTKYDIFYKCFLCDKEMGRVCDFIRHMIDHFIINKADAEALIERVEIANNNNGDDDDVVQSEEDHNEVKSTEINLMEVEVFYDDAVIQMDPEDTTTHEIEEIEDTELIEDDEIEKSLTMEQKQAESPTILRTDNREQSSPQVATSNSTDEQNAPITIRHVRRFTNRRLAEKNMSKERIHKCELCDASFTESSYLRIHRFRHLGIKPHACHICDKKYTSRTELTLHIRTHTDELPYICQDCGLRFRGTGGLYTHRQQHTKVRPYACGICGKSFFNKQGLNEHEISHTNERPYACTDCSATFQRHKALVQHKKLHSDAKEYICKVCNKAFAQSAGLYSHMKQHKIYKETRNHDNNA